MLLNIHTHDKLLTVVLQYSCMKFQCVYNSVIESQSRCQIMLQLRHEGIGSLTKKVVVLGTKPSLLSSFIPYLKLPGEHSLPLFMIPLIV